jgi:catechol 2,3-dioxygenase-like lactoylglutathione lyase family enzyme
MADMTISAVVAHARDLTQTRRFYEQKLGFRPLEASERAARYAVGIVDVEIRSARHDDVQVEDGVDESALMVFLVSDIDAMRSALEARGVEFQPTLRYEIGATAACFDPDGHNVTLYEPSAEAMTWPSASKIREIDAASARRRLSSPGARGDGLADSPLVYLFLFVRDTAESLAFYHGALGLPILEEDDEAGVVKYDGGPVILATHKVGGDAWCAVEMDLTRAKRISPVFEVANTDAVVPRLAKTGVRSGAGPTRDGGATTVLQDPNGHRFWLQTAVRKPEEDSRVNVH